MNGEPRNETLWDWKYAANQHWAVGQQPDHIEKLDSGDQQQFRLFPADQDDCYPNSFNWQSGIDKRATVAVLVMSLALVFVFVVAALVSLMLM